MSKFLRCFNFVKAFGNLPLNWLLVTFKCVNLVQCKIDCGMVPLMLLLAKLTTLNFWSLHRESASIVPLRFKFSSLICTTLVAFELHLTPFNLTKHGCDGDSIQVMLSTFFGSRALMKLKKDSDSDASSYLSSLMFQQILQSFDCIVNIVFQFHLVKAAAKAFTPQVSGGSK